jgi:hypothetical protein
MFARLAAIMERRAGYRNHLGAWHNGAGMIADGGLMTGIAAFWRRLAPIAGLVLLAACSRGASNAEPPRVETPISIAAAASSIAIPVTARLGDLETLLNARVPASFTTTEAQRAACAEPGVVRRIGCQFSGTVNRGPITVTAVDTNVIKLSMALDGAVDARELSRFVGARPVTARAAVEALVRLDVAGDWQPRAGVSIAYRWVDPPGFDAFGRRISLAAAADPLVARLIAQLEAAVPECLEKLQPRARLVGLWAQGFTVLPLNPAAPPVWLRVTPQALHFANYAINDGTLTLAVGATARTETFVGTRPAAPPPVPLPPPAPMPPAGLGRFRLHVPVIADYAGLETIVETALQAVETPPMQLRGLGTVEAQFGDVTIHETTGGRLAIGLAMSAGTQRQWLRPRGTVWLTAKVFNAPGSQALQISDVTITGSPDSASFRLLLAVARSRLVRDQIGRALSRDFAAEYARALAAARANFGSRRVGDFMLSGTIDQVTNGSLTPMAMGLYLPIDAEGTALLRLDPETR